MKKKFSQSLKSFFTEPRWEKVRGIFWFFLIITIIHIAWRFWATAFYFFPIQDLISQTSGFLVHHLMNESTFILSNVLNIKITSFDNSIIINNHVQLLISDSASGLRQMILFAMLMLIFPGPWKHKGWFIPMGIIILHLTNVFRIICLVVIAMHWPKQIQYAHGSWLTMLYYIVIFGLWLVWVEKITFKKPEH
jgi:exosortase/archaeosortase family protein